MKSWFSYLFYQTYLLFIFMYIIFAGLLLFIFRPWLLITLVSASYGWDMSTAVVLVWEIHWRIPPYQYTTYCTILYLVIFTLSWGSPGDRVNNPKGMNRQFPRNSLLMPIWTQTTSPNHLVTNPWFPPCPSFVLAVPSCVSHWSFSGMNLSYPFTFWFINSFKYVDTELLYQLWSVHLNVVCVK